MELVAVNYLAIFVSAILGMIMGSIWYGPLFGISWMKEMGFKSTKMEDAAKIGMGKTYGLMFVGQLLMGWVLAHAIVFSGTYLKMTGLSEGLMTGFFNWLGFVLPVSLGKVLWDGKSWKLWCTDSGYFLVTLLVMGSVLAIWV